MLIEEDYFLHEKVKLLLKIFKILMIVVGTMSFVRLVEKNYIQAFIDALFFLVVLLGHVMLTIDFKKYKIIVRFVFFAAAATSILLLLNNPENPMRFVWFSTIVYMVFYVFERKEGMLWIAALGLFLVILFFSHINDLHLNLISFLIWIMNMLIVLMISYWYADIEERSTSTLLTAQHILSEEVQKKTRELEHKTYELQQLNTDLERRIEKKIEESREHEKMLFRQARYAQMGEMISMIAHQWRQPLNAIATISATIQFSIERGKYDEDFLKKKVGNIGEYVQHLSSTIDDFRNFFKLDKEKKRLKFSKIADNALMLSESALENKNIMFSKEYHCSSCSIYTYPNEILHVILNLIKNAEDALEMKKVPEPKITLRIFKANEKILFEIEDNAGGIEEKIIDKIFDPYFTTKENANGTGLGLYMSKIIIEDHCDGKIEVENGKDGAVFRLLFPDAQNQDEEENLS